MKKLKNPFLLSGFYGKQYFCDREEELKALTDHFENERNVVLYSWRRMGKTALIKYLMNRLESNKNAETLYVDLLGTRDIADAIQQVTQATYEKFGSTSSGISATFQKLLGSLGVELSFDPLTGMPKFNIGLRSVKSVEQSLNAIGDFLANRKSTVLIALDEFQQITRYSDKNGEAIFRSWMQSFPGIRFIFSGSHRNMMASMFTERNRPFYRSAQLLQLNPIDLKPYKKFIQSHFKKNGKSIDDESIDDIYAWSRKQTYCIQLMCNRLYGMYDHVKQEHLPRVFEDIIQQESTVFSNYTNLLTNNQWNVLQAMAKSEPLTNPQSKEFLAEHRLGAASTVSSALSALQSKELIIKDEGAYYVHDVLLARWLQRL